MLGVIRRHLLASLDVSNQADPNGEEWLIASTANQVWSAAYKLGQESGYRNSQVTVIAPTGTISFWLGADTTGIEPDISLVKAKELAGGGRLVYVNESVQPALRAVGYSAEDQVLILEHLRGNGHLEGCHFLRPGHLPVFDCAFVAPGGTRSIHYMGHLKMMAAVQPFVSGSISKTCNLPESATVEDIANAYLEGWRMGLKCVAVYRNNCKRSQPLTASGGAKAPEEALAMQCPSCGSEAMKGATERCFICPNCGTQAGCSA